MRKRGWNLERHRFSLGLEPCQMCLRIVHLEDEKGNIDPLASEMPWSRMTPTWIDSLLLWVALTGLLGSPHGSIVLRGQRCSAVGSERLQAVDQSEALPTGMYVSLVKASRTWTLRAVDGGSGGPKKIRDGARVLAHPDTC